MIRNSWLRDSTRQLFCGTLKLVLVYKFMKVTHRQLTKPELVLTPLGIVRYHFLSVCLSDWNCRGYTVQLGLQARSAPPRTCTTPGHTLCTISHKVDLFPWWILDRVCGLVVLYRWAVDGAHFPCPSRHGDAQDSIEELQRSDRSGRHKTPGQSSCLWKSLKKYWLWKRIN